MYLIPRARDVDHRESASGVSGNSRIRWRQSVNTHELEAPESDEGAGERR